MGIHRACAAIWPSCQSVLMVDFLLRVATDYLIATEVDLDRVDALYQVGEASNSCQRSSTRSQFNCTISTCKPSTTQQRTYQRPRGRAA